MKIRMRMSVAGSFHGIENVQIGDLVDVPDDEGARYCKLGYAEPVTDNREEKAARPDNSEKRATKRGAAKPNE